MHVRLETFKPLLYNIYELFKGKNFLSFIGFIRFYTGVVQRLVALYRYENRKRDLSIKTKYLAKYKNDLLKNLNHATRLLTVVF